MRNEEIQMLLDASDRLVDGGFLFDFFKPPPFPFLSRLLPPLPLSTFSNTFFQLDSWKNGVELGYENKIPLWMFGFLY